MLVCLFFEEFKKEKSFVCSNLKPMPHLLEKKQKQKPSWANGSTFEGQQVSEFLQSSLD